MREVEFRGIDVETNEWVYGVVDSKGDCIFTSIGREKYIAIRKETLGQYTGLKDKNGSKMFEGDIVTDKFNAMYEVKFGMHQITCCGCCFKSHQGIGFYLKEINSEVNEISSDEDTWEIIEEVIGNIWDNPELLKVN